MKLDSTLISREIIRGDGMHSISIRGQTWAFGQRTVVMGILNVTPDSFSDGGRYTEVDVAIAQAEQMLEDGADWLDIGGESTRPGSIAIDAQEECRRVLPIIEALRKRTDAPISIDTYKAETARQALASGADLINDVWGGCGDPEMLKVMAQAKCPVVLMHNREKAGYTSLMDEIVADLNQSIEMLMAVGVAREQIILDPGIGFAKSFDDNLQIINQLDRLLELDRPVLLGTSRKRFIQNQLQATADNVIEGTAATVAVGITRGCAIIRVHDVLQMVRICRMTDAIVRSERQ